MDNPNAEQQSGSGLSRTEISIIKINWAQFLEDDKTRDSQFIFR
jgi:hypothetical protein